MAFLEAKLLYIYLILYSNLQGDFKVHEDKKHRAKYQALGDSEKKLQFFSARQIACRLLGSRDYLCQKVCGFLIKLNLQWVLWSWFFSTQMFLYIKSIFMYRRQNGCFNFKCLQLSSAGFLLKIACVETHTLLSLASHTVLVVYASKGLNSLIISCTISGFTSFKVQHTTFFFGRISYGRTIQGSCYG